ncbi:MAG: [protein-PII] uridylyltransferase [Nitrospiria bacterium]
MKQTDKIISALRPIYQEKYNKIKTYHQQGGGGLQVVKALSDLADQLLLKGFQLIDPLLAQQWGGTLVAVGGYGRQELSPGSDIDLMFLFPEGGGKSDQDETVASDLLHLLWDLGYKVGHSTRTVEESVVLARQDPLIATSLLESRFLHGNRTLFKRFHETFFSKVVQKTLKSTLESLQEGREKGRLEYGATPYLLEPNLKQSPGGLRDIHTLKWVASVRYRTYQLAQIYQWGHLSNIEYTSLVEAQDFLWRIRNQLHFLTGRAADHLTIELQEGIAPFFHFSDRRGLMHEYYVFTGRVLEISQRFTRDAFPVSRREKWRRTWNTRQVAQGFKIYSEEISIQSPHPYTFFENDDNILRLFLLAKTHSVRIADPVLEILYQISENKREAPLTPAALSLFKTLMTDPGGISNCIRLMHKIHFLWRVVPEFAQVHYMVQKSRSHAYTVDEHSFRAVEEAEAMMHEEGPLQETYAALKKKDILHLAILLHDVGKGREESHSEVGGKVAEAVATRLGYSEKDRALLTFLVRHHLSFSKVALFRDFEDEPILLQFTREMPHLTALKHLFILTCADIRATAPGIWSSWKGDLLLKLYHSASKILAGEALHSKPQKVGAITGKIKEAVGGKYPEIWLREILPSLTARYFLATSFEKILMDLKALFQLQDEPIQVKARLIPDQGLTEYTLYTYDWITTGLFSKMTGVLAAKGTQILSAQVFTHPNGIIIDTFKVIDPDHNKQVHQERICSITKDVQNVLTGSETVENLFSKGRRFSRRKASRQKLQAVRVELDNRSSHNFTVIDIYATDSRGLLYLIAKTFLDLGFVVHSAKIATRLDQVVDIFYVLGPDQRKITETESIQTVKSRLAQEIERHLAEEEA